MTGVRVSCLLGILCCIPFYVKLYLENVGGRGFGQVTAFCC